MMPEGKFGKWIRVTKKNPCSRCGHTDWCTYNDIYACCMRVPSSKTAGNGGYLHSLDGYKHPFPEKKYEEPEVIIDAPAMMWEWMEKTKPEWVSKFASMINVSIESLKCMDAAWASPHKAWAFPMKNEDGKVVGIRLRTMDGSKFAVKGSKQGIFCPNCQAQSTAYICEGPTDTAAALTIGLYAIGRPSCSGGIRELQYTLKRKRVTRAVIVSDNDDPGIRGSEILMRHLHIPSCRILLPAKDIRAFVKQGGTATMLDSILKNMVWTKPQTYAQSNQ